MSTDAANRGEWKPGGTVTAKGALESSLNKADYPYELLTIFKGNQVGWNRGKPTLVPTSEEQT